MLLKDRVAVVTGGRRGIGRAIATTLASEGANVVVADIVGDETEEVAQEIRQSGGEALAVRADISQKGEADDLVGQAVDAFGRIDILVNNAGLMRRGGVLEVTEEDLDAVFGINVKGTLFCSQAAARRMVHQGHGGSIVNLASVAAKMPRMNQLAYAVSKAAVAHMTKLFALELARHGIRVNAIAPGPTDAPMIRAGRSQEEVGRLAHGDLDLFRLGAPLGRLMTAQEQADAVVFLASDRASAITGHVLFVDGGEGMF